MIFITEKNYITLLTKELFETVCNELFVMCMKPLKMYWIVPMMTKYDIDEVISCWWIHTYSKNSETDIGFFPWNIDC